MNRDWMVWKRFGTEPLQQNESALLHTHTHTARTHAHTHTHTHIHTRHISDVNNTHIPEQFIQQVQTESGETITLTTTFNISEGLKQPKVADGGMFNWTEGRKYLRHQFASLLCFCFFLPLKRGLWLQSACLCVRHQTVVNFWSFRKKRINEKADGGKSETERNKKRRIYENKVWQQRNESLLNKTMSSFTHPHVVPNP